MKNGTASTNILSVWLSIGNGTTFPGKPSGKRQEELQPIIDDPTSIVCNEPIIESNHNNTFAELITAEQHIYKCFDKLLLYFNVKNWKIPGNI